MFRQRKLDKIMDDLNLHFIEGADRLEELICLAEKIKSSPSKQLEFDFKGEQDES